MLRDGRFFENEDVGQYRQLIAPDLTRCEYRKHDNPQVVRHAARLATAAPPFAATVGDSATMFVAMGQPRTASDLPNVVKVTWKPEWNGLGLDAVQLSRILAASTAAPGLGLQPRSHPAAIYWADGIAGANDRALRFRGLPVKTIED